MRSTFHCRVQRNRRDAGWQPRVWWLVALFLVSIPLAAFAAEEENHRPQDVFDGMRESFRPERAREVHLRYQFDLSGPEGGKWWVEVDNGAARQGHGAIARPDVTFIASDKDWVALSNHRLSGVWATVTGRLKIRGSQLAARKLDEMFP